MTSSIPFPSPPPFDCAAVDACLADYLDDEPPVALTAADRTAVDRHVATCARCRALVRDLRAIADSAAALPPVAPPRDLWADIAPRLAPRVPARGPDATDADVGPRVLPFEVRHLRHAPPSLRQRGAAGVPDPEAGSRPAAAAMVSWPRRRLAAAAVALVAVSAGTTYLATRASTTQAPAAAAVGVAAAPGARASAQPSAPSVTAPATSTSVATGPTTPVAPPDADGTAPRAVGGVRRDASDARLVARDGGVEVDAAVPAAAAYDREIATLRAAVRDRRGDLDSATVAVLVRNLGIIDAAIAQSRAALAHDPHSQFLGDQLTRALGQKVELLRTVALMPRT